MYGAQLMAPKFVICRWSVPSGFIIQTSAMRPCSSNRRQMMLRAVGREERAAVIADGVREPPLAGAVGAHDVDLREVARIDLELLLLGGRQRPVVGIAHRREHDPLPVGRVAGLGVVAARVRQPRELAGLSRRRRRSRTPGRSPRRSGAPCPTRGSRAPPAAASSTADRDASRRTGSGRCPGGRTRRSSCRSRARCALVSPDAKSSA